MTQAPITTIRELNERARAVWAQQDALMAMRLENPAIRETAFAALKTECERGVPLRSQMTLEHQLLVAAEAYDRFEEQAQKISAATIALAEQGARFRDSQRARARRPRRKVTEDNQNLLQIIGGLALKSEHRAESANELWPHLFAELERLNLAPVERKYATDLRKRAYAFCDHWGNDRQIAFGSFANIVSGARRKKKSH